MATNSKKEYTLTVAELCAEIRGRVSARDAAYRYGLTRNPQQTMARCLFHADKHPSMKLYAGTDARGGHGSGFYCFSCGAGGDVVRLTARILGVDTMGAVRQIDTDYNLHLPLKPLAPQAQAERERQRAQRQAQQAQRQAAETWRRETINKLDTEIQRANNLPPTPETWTQAQRQALKRREQNEYFSNLLMQADAAELLELYAQREGATHER